MDTIFELKKALKNAKRIKSQGDWALSKGVHLTTPRKETQRFVCLAIEAIEKELKIRGQ